MVILAALLSAAATAGANVTAGLASRRQPTWRVVLVSAACSLVVVVVIAAVWSAPASPSALLIGVTAGLLGGAAIPLAYRALAIGPIGVSATLIAASGTGCLVVGAMLMGDRVSVGRIAGLALCGAAVLAVQRRSDSGGATFAGPALAVTAGLAFGGFGLLMNRTQEEPSWHPLVAARIAALVVAVAIALLATVGGPRDTSAPGSLADLLLAASAGILDASGNVLLVIAFRGGDTLIVAILVSTAPVIAALLARVTVREKLTAVQTTGVLLGLAGAAVASAA